LEYRYADGFIDRLPDLAAELVRLNPKVIVSAPLPRLPKRDLSWSQLLASTPVPANSVPGNKTVVELGDVVRVTKEVGSPTIFRRDGRFTDMVLAELAGAYEAPIYGILDVDKLVAAHDWGALGQPAIR
jgi:hypothetical protein